MEHLVAPKLILSKSSFSSIFFMSFKKKEKKVPDPDSIPLHQTIALRPPRGLGGLMIVYITPDNNKHITGLHQHTPTKYKHNLPLAAEALLLHR